MFRIVLAVICSSLLATHAFAQQPQGGRLKTIATTKVVKIAHRTDATPFSFMSRQAEPTGYSVDLCKALVQELQTQLNVGALKIEWVPVTTQTRFDTVASGKADMECGASTITLSRMKQVDFSTVIFLETMGVVAREGIKSAGDLSGKKLAVIAGTSNEIALKGLQSQGRLAGVTVVPVKDRAEGVAALKSGQVDGYAADKLLLVGAEFGAAEGLTLLPEDLSFEPYGIALPRDDYDFRLAVNTALSRIYRSGVGVQMFRKWFEQVGLRPTAVTLLTFQLGAFPE